MPKTSKYSGITPIVKIAKMETKLRVTDQSHWNKIVWRQRAFKVHQDTSTIFLRYFNSLSRNGRIIDYPLMSVYGEYIDGYLSELRKYYEFEDYSVIITKLKSNKSIPSHRDLGEYFNNTHRIHIPILTNPQAIFTCAGVSMHMEVDTAYEIDNYGSEHSVVNGGPDRYHMIFDL